MNKETKLQHMLQRWTYSPMSTVFYESQRNFREYPIGKNLGLEKNAKRVDQKISTTNLLDLLRIPNHFDTRKEDPLESNSFDDPTSLKN